MRTALIASTIISLFEGAIAQMVALAVLMPIVAGVGGNAGTQTLAVTVRALATNQLTRSNRWRAVAREIRVALLNGATVALLIGIGVSIVFANPLLGGVIAAGVASSSGHRAGALGRNRSNLTQSAGQSRSLAYTS